MHCFIFYMYFVLKSTKLVPLHQYCKAGTCSVLPDQLIHPWIKSYTRGSDDCNGIRFCFQSRLAVLILSLWQAHGWKLDHSLCPWRRFNIWRMTYMRKYEYYGFIIILNISMPFPSSFEEFLSISRSVFGRIRDHASMSIYGHGVLYIQWGPVRDLCCCDCSGSMICPIPFQPPYKFVV